VADKKGRSRNTHKHMNIHSLVHRRTGEHMGCGVRVCVCGLVMVTVKWKCGVVLILWWDLWAVLCEMGQMVCTAP